MFLWYERASVCYAFLDDFTLQDDSSPPDISACRWFTRGWTLQELLAPPDVVFYDRNMREVGTRDSLADTLATITGILKQ